MAHTVAASGDESRYSPRVARRLSWVSVASAAAPRQMPRRSSAAEKAPDRVEDVAVEGAADVAEERERTVGAAEERPQRPGELGADEAEQQDPDVEERHAGRPLGPGLAARQRPRHHQRRGRRE